MTNFKICFTSTEHFPTIALVNSSMTKDRAKIYTIQFMIRSQQPNKMIDSTKCYSQSQIPI